MPFQTKMCVLIKLMKISFVPYETESLLLYGNNFRGQVSDEMCALSIENFEIDCGGVDSRIECQCCSKCW